jgi:hypothetical protein
MSVDKKTVDHVAAMLTDDPRIFAEAGLLSPSDKWPDGGGEKDWRVRGSNYDGDPSDYRVLATKIIKAIKTAGGSDDPEELVGQMFTSEFLSDRVGIDREDIQAAMEAEILIPGDRGHWQVSDKAFNQYRLLANQTDRRAARHANAIAKTSPPPPPPRRRESPHTEHVAPFTRQLGMLLENYDMDEVDSDPAGQAAVANVPAGGTDIKHAAEEIGVDSDEAQEMQNKLEQEKEEKKQREELRKKQVDPLFQQADKGLLDLSTNTATALAQQDDAMQALTGLDRQKDELETLLNKINSLL